MSQRGGSHFLAMRTHLSRRRIRERHARFYARMNLHLPLCGGGEQECCKQITHHIFVLLLLMLRAARILFLLFLGFGLDVSRHDDPTRRHPIPPAPASKPSAGIRSLPNRTVRRLDTVWRSAKLERCSGHQTRINLVLINFPAGSFGNMSCELPQRKMETRT